MVNRNSVDKLANYLEDNGYYGRFENPDIGVFLTHIYNSPNREISSLEEFSRPEIDNEYFGKKLKEIKKGKKTLDRKISLQNKESFWYKPVKFVSKMVSGNLENLLETQKENLNNFDLELDNVSKTLDTYKNLLQDGFDNLCNYWMKADSLVEDYSAKMNLLKMERNNTNLFSWKFLKNLRKKKKLKSEIKNYKEGIKTLENKKRDFEDSFSNYGFLFDKNKKDILFIDTLKNEKNYYKEILNASGNIAFNFKNDQNIYSLGSLEALEKFYNSKNN